MAFHLQFDPQARSDLASMRAFERAATLDTMQRILLQSPTMTSRTRIKRLRGLSSPQYRLRVDEVRVFYDVHDDEVYVLRVLRKEESDQYLKEIGHES